MEVAEGIPAPFPLVAHDPAGQPPRPPPRAPRQASRAATQAFTTCLLRDPPPPPTKAQDHGSGAMAQDHGTQAQHPATGGAPAASDPMPEQPDGENDEGNADMHTAQARLHCDGQHEHVGSVHHHSTHAQPHAIRSSPIGEGAPEGSAEDLSHPQAAAGHLTHPGSAVGDPSCLHAPTACQLAQAVDLHNQPCEDFQAGQASPGCQQQGYAMAGPLEHPGDMGQSGEGAPPTFSQHAELECHVPGPEQQQQQQQVCHSHQYLPHAKSDIVTLQQQQHWHQMHMGGSQHDQTLEQATNKSLAGGSPHPASCHIAVLSSSDAVQPAPSTTALTAPPNDPPRSLVDPPSPLHLSQSQLPPPQPHPSARPLPPDRPDHALEQAQGRSDTAGDARDESTADVASSHAAAPAASVGIASNEQRASATAAAQPAVTSDCLQAAQQPQQQRQPDVASPLSKVAHAVPHQDQAGSPPAESLHNSPGHPDKVDTCQPASVPQPAEEQFEQDELSQASSSESDEDFQPSEYEQDELSQASSSSDEEDEGADDEAFEVDELSQPESSSEDQPSPPRSESALRVQSPRQARSPQGIKSPHKGLPAYQEQMANPHSIAAAASGRSGVKRSREGSLSDDHKARLGFPKPPHSSKDALPGPQGRLKPSRLPFSSQDEPLTQLGQVRKCPAEGVAARQAGQKRARTASPKVGAMKAHRPDEEHVVQAQAAQQVSPHCK